MCEMDKFHQIVTQSLNYSQLVEDIFLKFAIEAKEVCHDLNYLVDKLNKEKKDLQESLNKALETVNTEKQKRQKLEEEFDDYKRTISKTMKKVLLKKQYDSLNEIKITNPNNMNETSLKSKSDPSISSSDSSYIKFEEELDCPKYLKRGKTWKLLQASGDIELTLNRYPLSSTKVDYPNSSNSCNYIGKGNKSILVNQNIFNDIFIGQSFTKKKIDNTENHYFQQKTILVPETCFACEKKICFGKTALKCKRCKGVYHVDCKEDIVPSCMNSICVWDSIKKTNSLRSCASLHGPNVLNTLEECMDEIEIHGSEKGNYKDLID